MIEFPQKLRPLFQPARYKVLHGGRGGAKSWGVARALLVLGASKPMRILCARETQTSIDQSVHQLLKDQIEAMNLSAFYTVREKEIEGKNGTTFSFAGLRQQGVTNIKSFEGTDVCWCEEAEAITKKSWNVLIPTIRKPGSEIWITFNPELDTGETYTRFVVDPPPGAVVIQINYYDNPWFPPELEAERVEMKRRDPEGYETTWEGKTRSAVEGAIYAKQIADLVRDGRYGNVPYDPLLLVHTVWDLGNANNMRVICVQRNSSELRLIDHIPGGGIHLADYVAELEAKKYRYGTDYIPHDGRAKQSGTGKSTEEMLQAMKRSVHVIPASDVEEGIRGCALMLPRLWVDKGRCSEWMDSIKRYKRHIHSVTGAVGGPVHDDASHDADTARYLAAVADQMSNDEYGGKIAYRNLGYR